MKAVVHPRETLLYSSLRTAAILTFVFASFAGAGSAHQLSGALAPRYSSADNDLVDDISRRSFRYFWEQTDPQTGLVLDRARTDNARDPESGHRNVASIAATGFGLTAFCIGADHRWVSQTMARGRVRVALRFLAERAAHEHGWFYHFMDASTGERRFNSEVSSIDTALLLAGVLTSRQAFKDDPEIVELATKIYNRVDFQWMLNGSTTELSHGWKPETGFLSSRWDTYSEHIILYLLAIGSPTHPISPNSWFSWKLPVVNSGGYAYISGGPLFTHQYSFAWADLRLRGVPQGPVELGFVPRVDYFTNSITATRAEQANGITLSRDFPGYSEKVWGITASDSPRGYMSWGEPDQRAKIDGTVVPSAAGGSMMFAPGICINALRAMILKFGKKIYGRYGFADAFNPTTGWVSDYVIGIDAGIILLSAENLRTGNVWEWFMSNPEAERSMVLVGFLPDLFLAVRRPSAISIDKGIDGTAESAFPGERPPIEAQIPASSFKFKIAIPDYWKY